MMKESTAPRKVYTRNDIVHVCFAGDTFGAPAKSTIDVRFPVTCELIEGKEGTCKVTQRRAKKKGITEMWSSVKVPRKHRKAA